MGGSGAAADALANVDLFQGLSKRDLAQVAAMTKELNFAAGQAITEEGERGGRFYVLLEGEAEVVASGDAQGQPEHLRTMGPNTYFGEIGLLERIPRTATVTAATECRAYRIDGDEFLDALAAAPPATTLLEVAGGRLARTHPSRRLTYAASSEAAPVR